MVAFEKTVNYDVRRTGGCLMCCCGGTVRLPPVPHVLLQPGMRTACLVPSHHAQSLCAPPLPRTNEKKARPPARVISAVPSSTPDSCLSTWPWRVNCASPGVSGVAPGVLPSRGHARARLLLDFCFSFAVVCVA